MAATLADLQVLAIDCQAGGATPAHGDLLELGWAVCGANGLRGPVEQRFVLPRTTRKIAAAVRELTGWSEACLADAVSEQAAWAALAADCARLAGQLGEPPGAPAVIHYARFELGFLRNLHARCGEAGVFPLEPLCLHAISARLFPDLPRRNIRALSGYLGHSTDRQRNCAGHVEATAFIWRALLPELAQRGLRSFADLAAFVAQPAPSTDRTRRVFPLARERRRALPDRPGVYRFLRRNGDLLYVGKATSLKKRVAGHFRSGGKRDERVLELLTQVHTVDFTETASILEAALLETDEIKRLSPPYNVQLRAEERQVWYAARDLAQTAAGPDALHRSGPLPSARALMSIAALIALADGAEPTPALQACALSVPRVMLPEPALFTEGLERFAARHFGDVGATARVRIERAARALWIERRRTEPDPVAPDAAPDEWDLARVVRRLERGLTGGGLLMRRARLLCLLADADVAFRERGAPGARALSIAGGQIAEQRDLPSVGAIAELPPRRFGAEHERRACFDPVSYDRLRVLATELARVQAESGEIALRFGRRVVAGEQIARLMRWV